MSSNKMTVVKIWNDENHHDWQEATRHGVCETVIVNSINTPTHLAHINEMLQLSNRVTSKLSITLKSEVVHLKCYTVNAQVLEWNEYSVEVWAQDKESAKEIAIDKGMVTFTSCDVSYGMAGYNADEPTDDRHHVVT